MSKHSVIRRRRQLAPKPDRLWQRDCHATIEVEWTGGYKDFLVSVTPGGGKRLHPKTPVLLYSGEIRAAGDIVAGDRLMGPDSRPRTVLSTNRGVGPLYRIKPARGEPWVCNDVHVLTLVKSGAGTVLDISLDEFLCRSKYFQSRHKLFQPPSGVEFESRADPDIDPYWLGVWVGDGTKALRNVSVSKPDREIAVVTAAVAAEHNLAMRTGGSGTCPTHYVTNGWNGGKPNVLLDKLRDLFGRNVERFPLAVSTASRAFRTEFLAGVIDSDGYVHAGCIEVTQKSDHLADGIAFIARSLGFSVTRSVKMVNGKPYHRMWISGDFQSVKTKIPRKATGKRKHFKCATRQGFKVEHIGPGEYAGFSLDGDGRFLLGDFTVTHNTILGLEQARRRRTGETVEQSIEALATQLHRRTRKQAPPFQLQTTDMWFTPPPPRGRARLEVVHPSLGGEDVKR